MEVLCMIRLQEKTRRENMTIYEVSKNYRIPLKYLNEYENWCLYQADKRVKGEWQYDEQDIKLLSMVMTLYDVGFKKDEVEAFMRLLPEKDSTKKQRLGMLNRQREKTLAEIHLKETQISRLDYLRYEIQPAKEE